MSDMQIHRDMGRMEATIKAQGEQITTLVQQQKEMQAQVQEIHDVLTEARGSWKTLLMVGGLSSFITGLLFKIATVFSK
ncbi:hypothetical protein N7643_04310 [Stenotrophomonas maltophilia]|jgi:hypothetical protein|nr:hypothetical protein [Stenotrophomonas maltophilia]EED40792.1 hypothetical protein SSKA14_3815 [Stenotrophomonas sp. SKA14]MBA0428540.1 hypothetical protein [Stenotrophomonas maltophilia]MDG9766150.1 hypothetical protein [Stenotrophomonas maltophilia]MDH0538686.1 hypothetical protein [Stenotrophomonas maltophilia]HDS1639413.1 hypothetical protein [Stenotrophomonas maltophilia]